MNARAKLAALLVAIAVLSGGRAHAIELEFDPVLASVSQGDMVSVDVVVLEPGGVLPLIGAFDINVLFDAAVLSFDSVTFGAGLGGDPFGQSVIPGAGLVNVFEFALAPLAQTGAPFTLFTVTFDAIATGVSALTMTGNLPGGEFLSDDLGIFDLPVSAVGTGAVEVTRPTAAPEPASLLLLILGAVLFIGLAARRW